MVFMGEQQLISKRGGMEPPKKSRSRCKRDCFSRQRDRYLKERMYPMRTLEKEVIRMELQIGQLIHIIANLNERIGHLEDERRKNRTAQVHKIPLARRQ